MSSRLRREDLERYDINHRFTFHPGTEATDPKHDEVRDMHRTIAFWVLANVPSSRERNLALTRLQESMMWCNTAVAVYTEPEPLPFGMPDRS